MKKNTILILFLFIPMLFLGCREEVKLSKASEVIEDSGGGVESNESPDEEDEAEDPIEETEPEEPIEEGESENPTEEDIGDLIVSDPEDIVEEDPIINVQDNPLIAEIIEPTIFVTDTYTDDLTETWGEDSDYQGMAPNWGDNGNGTVTDNITGLIWQREDDTKSYSYNNAIAYCMGLELGGIEDWRLPNVGEIYGLVDFSRGHTPSYGFIFVDTFWPLWEADTYGLHVSFWSKTMQNDEEAWKINFISSSLTANSLTGAKHVRCVNGDEIPLKRKFEYNLDGTITSKDTFFVWYQDENEPMVWEDAISFCENLDFAQSSEWKLPNIKELQTLIDYKKFNPAVDDEFFPGVMPSEYWSSTPTSEFSALFVNFFDGVVSMFNKDALLYPRCIRTNI